MLRGQHKESAVVPEKARKAKICAIKHCCEKDLWRASGRLGRLQSRQVVMLDAAFCTQCSNAFALQKHPADNLISS